MKAPVNKWNSCSLLLFTLGLCAGGIEAPSRVEAYLNERQPVADMGNGYFRNPVLVGTHGDVTVCRKGEDFYMTHTNTGTNKLLIWHSKDLVNWRPLDYALKLPIGRVWAIDLDYYEPDDLFYLYLPVILEDDGIGMSFTNMVMWAKDPGGPWEGPVDLGFGRIDPGHVADDKGNRYVWVDKGYYHKLTPDGLATEDLEGVHAYDGWPIPEDWVYECHCLESPKFFRRGNYYYMISAQGGTGGPSTSHMAVIARAQHPTGPWENSPYNPLVRTRAPEERWWRQGHGDIVDDVEGNWWMLYTGYERGFENFRKVNLLLPIGWTDDAWPVLKDDAHAENILKKPAGMNVGHGLPLSDPFEQESIGLQWHWFEDVLDRETYAAGDGRLIMRAKGTELSNASRLAAHPTNHAYDLVVEVEIAGDVKAGIYLGNRSLELVAGVGLQPGSSYLMGRRYQRTEIATEATRVWVRLRNNRHDISYAYSEDGVQWTPFTKAARLEQTDEVFGLYAIGDGHAVFRNFRYLSID